MHCLQVILLFCLSVVVRSCVVLVADMRPLAFAAIIASDFMGAPVGSLVDSAVSSMSTTASRFRCWHCTFGLLHTCVGMLVAMQPPIDGYACRYGIGCKHAHMAMYASAYICHVAARSSALPALYRIFSSHTTGIAYPTHPGCIPGAPVSPPACPPQDGFYGRQRMFASIGWGALSPAGGALLQSLGFGASFLAYLLLSLPCVLALARLRIAGLAPAGAADDGPAAPVGGGDAQACTASAAGTPEAPRHKVGGRAAAAAALPLLPAA